MPSPVTFHSTSAFTTHDVASSRNSAAPDAAPATRVLGLGNDILGDDAVGLVIARRLRAHPDLPASVEIREHDGGCLSLLDELTGADHVLLVDAISTGAKPGTPYLLRPDDLPSVVGALPHGLGLRDSLELGAALGLPMPRSLRILAIEIADAHRLREGLGPELLDALPDLIRLAFDLVKGHEPETGLGVIPDAASS